MSNNDLFEYSGEYSAAEAYLFGAMVSNDLREIMYVNAYFTNELKWDPNNLIGSDIYTLFTPSSKIFCESYLVPILTHEGKCEELQLTLFDGKGNRIPIVVSARMDAKGSTYWSFFNATRQDKLYDELVDAREKLEEQAIELKTLSSIDELTGLLNRREMNTRASLILAQHARAKRQASIMLLDIDHFKKVNDKLGHLEGDEVLAKLGKLLQKFGRKADLISRYGGEEFCILLPETDVNEAKNLSKRLHELIATIKVAGKSLTVSIGISISSENMSLKDLYRQSDKALYKAKDRGRNRTECFDEEA